MQWVTSVYLQKPGSAGLHNMAHSQHPPRLGSTTLPRVQVLYLCLLLRPTAPSHPCCAHTQTQTHTHTWCSQCPPFCLYAPNVCGICCTLGLLLRHLISSPSQEGLEDPSPIFIIPQLPPTRLCQSSRFYEPPSDIAALGPLWGLGRWQGGGCCFPFLPSAPEAKQT